MGPLVGFLTLVAEDWCPRGFAGSSSISVEQDSDADFDDRKVSVAFADVDLYVALMMEERAHDGHPGGQRVPNNGSVAE
jgi:hypothetical protein